MNDSYRMGWSGAAALVALWHPEARPICVTPRRDDDVLWRSTAARYDHSAVRDERSPAPSTDWAPFATSPAEPGWYEAGSLVSHYLPNNIRAWFDGARWVQFIGLVDPAVTNNFTPENAGRIAFACCMWRGKPMDFPALSK